MMTAGGLLVWGTLVLAVARPAFTGWLNAWRLWANASFGGTLTPGIVAAPFRHLGLLMLAAGFAAACAGPGGLARRWLPIIRGTGRDRRALDVLFGFALFGGWHLGLALAGVFVPRVLAAGVLAALLLPGARSLIMALVKTCGLLHRRPAGWGWWAAAFAAFAVPALVAFVPDAHVDALTYHLAIPEQILRAGKYTFEGAGLTHLFPLTAELNYALAIMIGADALPHLLQLVPFLAAVALLAGRAADTGGPVAGGLAILLAVTWGETGRQLGIAKNDLAAAAFPLAAVASLWRAAGGAAGWLMTAALLAGCGAATKTSGLLAAATLAGVVIAVFPRPSFPVRWVALAGLPFVPWAIRGWLMTGDPLWPALTSVFPGALWDDPSSESLRMARGVTGFDARWHGLLNGLRMLAGEQPALAVALPVAGWMAWRDRGRPARAVLGWAAATAAGCWVIMPGEWARLSLPAWLAAGAVVAAELPAMFLTVPPAARTGVLAAGLILTWVPLGRTIAETTDTETTLKTLAGALSPTEALALRRSTLHEAGEALRRLPGLRRVIGFGDIRGYRLPGRFLAERCFGRTHAWVLAGESNTPERIAVKLRQWGVTHILYNFVTEAFPHPQAAPFEWDPARLKIWRAFVGRHLEIVVPPSRLDHVNGGFLVYGIRRRPLGQDPAWLPYLPGIESLYYGVTMWGMRRSPSAWLRAADSLDARVRNVDFIHDLRGVALRIAGRWPEAYAAYAIGVNHGTINDSNYWDMAVCAFQLGRLEESFRLFNRAVEISPYLKPQAEPVFAVLRKVLAQPNP